jgi:hypothetical protein
MLHSDMHGRWTAAAAEERAMRAHRQLCAEMLEQLAAGGSAPYPFGDALYLLDAMHPRVPPDGALRRLGRFLTSAIQRHPMEPRSGEGSGDGRSSDVPVRRMPA